MKKRLTALAAALMMLFVTAAPVFAADESIGDTAEIYTASELTTDFHHVVVTDSTLSYEEQVSIEEKAEEVYQANGVDLFVYVSNNKVYAPMTEAYELYRTKAKTNAAIIMVRDDESSYLYTRGRAEFMLTEDELNDILTKADAESSVADAALAFIKLTGNKLAANGVQPIPDEMQYGRLVDDAELLTETQQKQLLEKLDSISEARQMDVVVVTQYSLDGKTSTEYADDFFDYNGYGYGEDHDGILLLIGMEDRDWAITTTGKAITVFTDAGQEYMTNQFVSYLSNGDYYGGFAKFADLCDEFIEYYDETGTAYDINNLPKDPFPWGMIGIGSLFIGFIPGIITVSVMKGKLKTVKPQAAATAYTRAGSLKVTQRTDLFLYNVVNRTARPQDTGGGGGGHSGGSSTHHSSSGTSHGGSHGHF